MFWLPGRLRLSRSSATLSRVRWLVLFLLPASLGCVGTAKPPYEYVCRRAPSIVIDGALDDWRGIPWTRRFRDIIGKKDAALSTRAALAWDDRYLYVAARMEQPHLAATLTKHDAVIYHDDDFEIFLDPSGRGRDYFELEINALATVFDLMLSKPYALKGKADHRFDFAGLKKAVALQGSLNDPADRDRGWTVELAIPWDAFLGFSRPRPGDVWRCNMARVEWKKRVEGARYVIDVDETKAMWLQPENWSWSPQFEVAMHKPEHWGYLRFR